VDDLLLKCLDSDQTKVTMGEVHEGICGTHQLAPKMKWLLRRGGFYWLLWSPIISGTTKDVKNVKSLIIFN
jgi:hypothetical protein